MSAIQLFDMDLSPAASHMFAGFAEDAECIPGLLMTTAPSHVSDPTSTGDKLVKLLLENTYEHMRWPRKVEQCS